MVIIMSDSGRARNNADDSNDEENFGDDLDVAGMTMGEYRRLHAQIEAEGRRSLSSETLERYDAADAEMQAAVRNVREVAARHAKIPSIPEDLRRQVARASKVDFGAMYESIARVGMSPAERLGREALASTKRAEQESERINSADGAQSARPMPGPASVGAQLAASPVDESLFEGIAEAREEREAAETAHREAELDALAKIGGTMEALQREQREAAESSWRVSWWGVGLMGLTLIVSTASLLIAW